MIPSPFWTWACKLKWRVTGAGVRARHALGCLLAVLALFCGQAGVVLAADEVARTLKVTVVDAATQRPVAGAEVSIQARDAIKATTDAAGVAMLPARGNGEAPERESRFGFGVKAAGFEPRQVEWFSDGGRVFETVPAEYKVALPKGGTAGGTVRDEKGAPISGAKVVLYASGLRGRSLGGGAKLQQEYGNVWVNETEALVTDQEGRWRMEHFPTEITQGSVDIIRPGGGRTRFLVGMMSRGPGERGGTLEVDALLKQAAVFTLKEGVTLRGIVVDEAGRPVSGVQLRAREAASRNQPHTFLNQPDGSFALENWDVDGVLVTAEKEGFQARSVTITATGDAGPGRIVLTPAKPLIVRVVDENEAPIAGAELQSDPNPSREQIVTWKATTDAAGRATWATASDKPIKIWVAPPKGTSHPFGSALLTADGTEHVIRLRAGADKEIRVRVRVVDATTGEAVPKFEVWRKLANQPFRPWGEPADKGEWAREFNAKELPNGWVPSYRLQVRAAGYTGWASEQLDFSYGDQILTLKMAKGASILTDEPPSGRTAGMGLNGENDPQLLVLGATVGRLLETGDVAAFVKATQASLDDWKRLLPAGASETDLPLGPDPTRMLQHREKALTASAAHVLSLARRAGLAPGKVRFTVKTVSSTSNSSGGFQIAGRPVMMPLARALRIVLTGELAGSTGDKKLAGEYELSLGNARKFPSGWRVEDGVRWSVLPPEVGDEALRSELALINRITPSSSPGDQRTLSGMDDPALLRLGVVIGELLREGNAQAFVKAARLTRDETADFYVKTDRAVTPEIEEAYTRNSAGLEKAAGAMIALQKRMGIDLSDTQLTVKQVLAERPYAMRFGQPDGIGTSALRVTFNVETERKGTSGKSLAGSYTVAVGSALRVGNRWVLVDDKIRFQDFPEGLVSEGDLRDIKLENYVAENRTLPPGHTAPDVPLIKLSDSTKTSLAAYRGKVVVLEFWAVWCGPCQEPMEKLQHLREANPAWKDRVEIVTVSIDAKAETAQSHLTKKGWSKTTNMWAGTGEWKAEAPAAFRVNGVPTSYVIDREGRVVKGGHPMAMDFAALVTEQLKAQ